MSRVLKVRNCEVCGKEFNPKGGKQKTCEAHLGLKKIICEGCNAELIVSRYNNQKWCDECRIGERICKHCGKLFTPSKEAKKSLFCSVECGCKDRYAEGRYFKKMLNGYSKKGRNKEDNSLMEEARNICYSHYERKCSICGFDSDTNKVHVHHIDEDRKNKAIENLIPVCDPCHRIIHVLIRRLKEHPDYNTLNNLAEVVNLNLLKTGKP